MVWLVHQTLRHRLNESRLQATPADASRGSLFDQDFALVAGREPARDSLKKLQRACGELGRAACVQAGVRD